MNTLIFFVNTRSLLFSLHVCVCSSGKDIWHYDIQILPSNECVFNRYTFTSLPDAVMFYTENRLGSVFLKEPVSKSYDCLVLNYDSNLLVGGANRFRSST